MGRTRQLDYTYNLEQQRFTVNIYFRRAGHISPWGSMNGQVEDTLPTLLSFVLAIVRSVWFSLFKKSASGTVNPILLSALTTYNPASHRELLSSCPTWCWQEWLYKRSVWLRNEILASLPHAFWGSRSTAAGITRRWQNTCTPPESTGGELSHLSLERQPAQPPLLHSSRALCSVWHLALGVPVAEQLTSGGKSFLIISNQP